MLRCLKYFLANFGSASICYADQLAVLWDGITKEFHRFYPRNCLLSTLKAPYD
jgi:hypothetical protein